MRKLASLAGSSLVLSGCDTAQNALGGQGIEGANFLSLFALFMIACTIIYALVVAALISALLRKRATESDDKKDMPKDRADPPLVIRLLTFWTVFIIAVLAALSLAGFFTDRSNAQAGADPELTIHVTGSQWWWEVEYEGRVAGETFRTANELHLPLGVPVEITLQSTDVIHSIWIPNLAGKQDLIPGRTTDIQIVPRKTGVFRGQCAEFCGVQHAHMALDVTVESARDFDRWVTAQRRVALAPATPRERAGLRLFTQRQCSTCHAVAGTSASATVGPNLTHLASRRSIAAGTLPMSRDNLARWVSEPQLVKPGTNMPKVDLTSAELAAITAYMARLR